MSRHKYPPRGYRKLEYPLPHNFSTIFNLLAEDTSADSTIIPLIRATEAFTTPEAIEVNPRNANFAEETGASIHMGSIVPRLNVTFSLVLSKGAIETDKIRALKVNWMPIYISFLDSLEAMDDKTAVSVEDILELAHDTTNKDVWPLYNGTNLATGIGTCPMNTVAATEVFGDWGLSVDTDIEATAFNKELFYDSLQYYTNAGMLKAVTGSMNTVIVKRDRPFLYHSNNFTNPRVKRGNPYTFCGILFHLPSGDQADQITRLADTTNIAHIQGQMSVRYDEWNPEFDQSAL